MRVPDAGIMGISAIPSMRVNDRLRGRKDNDLERTGDGHYFPKWKKSALVGGQFKGGDPPHTPRELW